MREVVVLDASAALAALKREPERPLVQQALRSCRGAVLVPTHFWLEVANSLQRRHRWTPEQVVAAFRELDELDIQSVDLDRPSLLLAVDVAARYSLSSYDAMYLALAESADADLLTLDADLAAAAGARSVLADLPHPHRLHEELAAYGASTTWANHGRYLAELRHAALESTPAVKA